jgi:hypothetical protein
VSQQATITKDRMQRFYQKYFVRTEWNIGVVEASPAALRELVASGRLGPVRWCPRVSVLGSRADPFVWPLGEEVRVIYEEVDQWSGRGHIRSISLKRFSRWQRSRREIVQPYHLSYPFIIRWESVWYCIPESARTDGVDLYAWDASGGSWQLKRRLLDGVAIVDATLFRYDEIWYLFGTTRGPRAYDTLQIWWSPSLEGEWLLHGSNPTKVDLRSARSAGALFEVDGRWYRPAQDCTNGYGGALTINRIEMLTPVDFRETTVSRVQPDPNGPYPHGLHTLAVYENQVVIDGKRVGFSAWLAAMKAARTFARLLKP